MTSPRTVAAVLVLGAVTWAGVDRLADATQTRPDTRTPGTRTEIVLDVEGRKYRQHLDTGAHALWATCSATVSNRLAEPGIVGVGDGTYRLVLEPALGEHGGERLLGCLEDLTVERLRGTVVSVRHLPAPSP